eukprot:jgi/Hompol1/7120/HPOL_002983-RA
MLLYFHIHINHNTTWGFELFDAAADSGRSSAGDARSVLELKPETIQRLHDCLSVFTQPSQHCASSDSRNSRSISALSNVVSRIRSVLYLVPWHAGPVGHCESAIKPKSTKLGSTSGTIKVRSHLIVISRVPKTINDLRVALDFDATLSRNAKRNNRVDDLLLLAKNELVTKEMWEEFVGNRVALSWIDVDPATSPTLWSNQDESTTTVELIKTAFCAALRSIGGWLYTTSDLLGPFRWLELPKCLQLMHPRTVDTAFARMVITANRPHELLKLFDRIVLPVGSLKSPVLTTLHIATLHIEGIPEILQQVAMQVTYLTRYLVISNGNVLAITDYTLNLTLLCI